MGENDRAAEIEEFKTNINGVMKELMGSFKDLQFFSGESMDPDAMIAMCEYKDVMAMAWRSQFSCSLNTALKRRRFKKLFQHMTAKFKTRGRQKTAFTSSSSFILYHNSPCFCSNCCYLKQQTNHLITYCHQIGFYSMSKCRIKISQY